MEENEWPVFSLLTNDGELFYSEMFLGNRYNSGDGWLMVLPWGVERKRGGIAHGDNRIGIEPENVVALTLLNAPAEPKEGGKP